VCFPRVAYATVGVERAGSRRTYPANLVAPDQKLWFLRLYGGEGRAR
jgi:hypothetical protein